VSEFLRLRGYEVSVATSVAAGVRAAREGFEVLVSDIGLPDGTGLELLHMLSREHPVRAVALSGYGTRADVARSRDAGFRCHLTKPVDPDELVEAIEQVACEAVPSLAETGGHATASR
jgi:DNA-binding response OmpR family regulator